MNNIHTNQAAHTIPTNAGRTMAARDLRRGDMVYDAIGAREGKPWQLVRTVAVRNDGSVQAVFDASEQRMTGGIPVRVVRAH